MKYIYYEGKDKFFYKNISERKCKNNEVEIRTKVMGLCGSDLHKFLHQSPNRGYLHTNILGHEICGVVTNKGDKVSKINIGDIIVVNPFCSTKKFDDCESLSLTNTKVDIVGRSIDGGFSEIVYLPENCVYKLPESISIYDSIFIDDIAVALHGIHYIKSYKNNFDDVAVVGDGPLGILIYRLLKSIYCNKNVVLFAKNMQKIKNLDINAVSYDKISDYENKFDVILEAVGGSQSSTLNNSIFIGKPNFIILCYGVYDFNYKAELDVRSLFYKQGLIKGINSYCNIYDDFINAIKQLSTKKIIVSDLVTNKVDFDQGIDYIKNYYNYKDNIKTIFEVK